MLKRLLLTIMLLSALPIQAGPGISGGNPSMAILSPMKDYFFEGLAPTDQAFAPSEDQYTFGLAGLALHIESIAYDAAGCPQRDKFKTVCPLPVQGKQHNFVVVFADKTTFILKFTDQGIGAEGLKPIADRIVATFSRTK